MGLRVEEGTVFLVMTWLACGDAPGSYPRTGECLAASSSAGDGRESDGYPSLNRRHLHRGDCGVSQDVDNIPIRGLQAEIKIRAMEIKEKNIRPSNQGLHQPPT